MIPDRILFVTVVADQRRRILASKKSHDLLIKCWQAADEWAVGHYVVMPDHVHLFVREARHDSRHVDHWVKYWKSLYSREVGQEVARPIWQRGHWDFTLRNSSDYEQKWRYVRENPVRAGLVGESSEWEFQGCLTDLGFVG